MGNMLYNHGKRRFRMSTKKLLTSILFIDKDRIDVYLPDKKTVVSCDINEEAVKYCEVMDRDKLHTQLKSFIETNKLSPSSLIVVLAKNILFEKDFIKGQETDDQQQLQSEQFIDNVPFESVGSKTVPLEKGFRVIAANADLYESIMTTFRQSGFLIQALLPITLYAVEVQKLTADSTRVILQKSESLKRYSLVSDSGNFIAVKEAEEIVKKKNYTLIAISIVMFLVAGVLIIFAVFFLK